MARCYLLMLNIIHENRKRNDGIINVTYLLAYRSKGDFYDQHF